MQEIETLVEHAADTAQPPETRLRAFGEIVLRFQNMAYGCAYAVLGDSHLAEDAAQEAFVAAYRHLADLRKAKAFSGWLRRIVLAQCYRMARRKMIGTVDISQAGQINSPQQLPIDALAHRELTDRLLEAVASLPEPQRIVISLFYIDRYSQGQIAAFLETSLTVVKKRLYDARKKLKERMVTMVADGFRERSLSKDFRDKTVQRIIKEAQGLLGKDRAPEAEQLLRRKLRRFDQEASLLRMLNKVLMQGRVYKNEEWNLLPELAEHGRAIIKAGTVDRPFVRNFSSTLLTIPDIPHAIRFIETWLAQNPPDQEMLGKLAWARSCAGELDVAEATWARFLAVADGAERKDVASQLILHTAALVDSLTAAGATERAAGVLNKAWKLLLRTKTVGQCSYPRDTKWPHLFRLCGRKAFCAKSAQTILNMLSATRGESSHDAIALKVWLQSPQQVIDLWHQWATQHLSNQERPMLLGKVRDIGTAFINAGQLEAARILACDVWELVKDKPPLDPQHRDPCAWWRGYLVWSLIRAGELDAAESTATQPRELGESYWLKDVAVARGVASPADYMRKVRRRGIPAADRPWGGDAQYHLAREAAAAGKEATAFAALARACEYWRNPPLGMLQWWQKDKRWGRLRQHRRFANTLDALRKRVGPLHGQLHYFPGW